MAAQALRLQVTGMEQVAAKFKALGYRSKDLERAFAAISGDVARDAHTLAPKRTGALAADIRASRAKTRATVSVGRKSLPYAGPINYGWRKRNIEPSLFMNRAANDKAESSAETIAREMQRIINSVGMS